MTLPYGGYACAPSLVVLRDAINEKWPHRNKASDGWIGDAAHQMQVSDHNPNVRGMVDALDVTGTGIDPLSLVNGAIKDPRTHFVIWSRTVWRRESNFHAGPYDGVPHTSHVHISILQDEKAEQSKVAWALSGGVTPPPPKTYPYLKQGSTGENVVRLQELLGGLVVDGDFGPLTRLGVLVYQTQHGLSADGIAGPLTLKMLGF